MKFVLPLPPGINRTYGISRKGKNPMYKKGAVVQWEFDAGYTIKQQWIGKREYSRTDKCIVRTKYFYRNDRDIDASNKVLFDLLQHMRIYKNDMQIVDEHTQKFQDLERPRVEIVVEFLSGEAFLLWQKSNRLN